ncbi:MAG TPA: HAD family phosphatase [Planctomycetota bacterium]|jgi:HAD superfamily hydrolase (TIGR01509 family)
MNIRALLFDMDGLLLDSEMLHIRAYQRLTEQLGHPQDAEALKRFIGRSCRVTCGWLINDLGCEGTIDGLMAREKAIYFELLHQDRPEPLPGVAEFFNLADTKGLKRALVSSSPGFQVAPTMQVVTEHLKRPGTWSDHFHAVCTGDRVQHVKPSPDLYLLAAQDLKLSPTECLAFEDSPAGVQSAAAAGCKVVAVPNMYITDQDVSQGKADYVFDTLAEAYHALHPLLN